MKKIVKSNTYILLLTFVFLSSGLARGEGFLSISYWKHKIFVPGEILVKFKRWVPEKTKERVLRASGAFVIRPFPTLEIQHLGLPPSASVEEALRVYRQDPAVKYAEPNYIIHACQVFPNDPVFDPEHPYYGLLWGLYNFGQTVGGRSGLPGADINASDAWEVTRGGEGVIIAVIDTGVAYSHPDLAANMWTNPGEDPWLDPHDLTTGDGIDNDGNGYNDDWRGWDFVDGDNDPVDYHGHGTHVAGTIAAIGDNGKGITGVMWEAGIMPLRILNSHGMGAVSNAIRAIHYAVQKGARIINVSWGGGNYSQALYDAMASSDVLFVAAAGNDSLNTDSNPFYPASYDLPNIISVAATDPRDRLGSFSNWGPSTVDVAAPGATIYSTSPSTHSIGGTFPDNVESGPGNWTTGGTTPWAIVDTPYESPTHCWSDSPEDNYSNATDSWLILPTVDLSEKRLSRLTYYLRMETEVYRDFLYVEASIDGMNWTNIYGQGVGYSGSTGGAFVKISDDISGYDGEPTVHIRLRLVADPQHTFDGVYVDDVDIASISHTYDGDEFQFLQGTSMAAPHVSGLAGLLVSAYPALPLEELRWRILNGTDELGDLTEKVATGGRINASNSLRLPMAPSRLCVSQASGTQIDLQWVDNSPDEEGFTVERRVRGGRYREITRVDPDTTAYSDTNPEGEAPYTYRVRAFNGYGNSGYSNEAWTANSDGGVAFTAGGGGSGSGGCFVATAAYGSPYHRRIDLLRAFRDEYLTDHPMGKKWVQLYYRYSPPVARFIADHPAMRKGVRIALSPFVALSAGMVAGSIPRIFLIVSASLGLSSATGAIVRRGKSRS